MTARRAPGMDHDLYPFSPMPDRAALAWPGGARVAFAPVVYLEHWELHPPEGALRDPRFRDPFGDFRPDYRSYTWREYGARLGIFRIFEALDRHGLHGRRQHLRPRALPAARRGGPAPGLGICRARDARHPHGLGRLDRGGGARRHRREHCRR